jgi:hypothetical protein
LAGAGAGGRNPLSRLGADRVAALRLGKPLPREASRAADRPEAKGAERKEQAERRGREGAERPGRPERIRARLEQLREQLQTLEDRFYHGPTRGATEKEMKAMEKRWNTLKSRELAFQKAERLMQLRAQEQSLKEQIARGEGRKDSRAEVKKLGRELAKNQKAQQKEASRTWTSKRDARGDWKFEVVRDGNRVVVIARGKLSDPATVINWRKDTVAGGAREGAIRAGISRGTGDDAGHMIAAQFGADPEGYAMALGRHGLGGTAAKGGTVRLNYGRQNFVMNRGTGWRSIEAGLAKHVKTVGSGRVEMTVTRHLNARHGQRDVYRTVTATQKQGDKDVPVTVSVKQRLRENGRWVERDVEVTLDRYTAGNFPCPPRP